MEVRNFILRVVTITLAIILLAVVLVMLFGLFDERVDNKEIFSIIGPAFHTVIGVFVGILSSRILSKRERS